MADSNILISNTSSDQISIDPTNISGATGTPPPTSDLEWYFIQLVNDDRAAAGVGPVTLDAHLQTAAASHTAWMTANGIASHIESGIQPMTMDQIPARMTAAGYDGQYMAENIWWTSISGPLDQAVAQQLEQSLMNDPPHAANILNPAYTDIGLSLGTGVIDGFNAAFVTQDFGTPTANETGPRWDVGTI